MKVVLVVDDSTTMRRMIMSSLRGLEGIRFEEARSGLEAIEKLVLAPVDLVILDLNMPDMHGMEVLGFLQNHARFQSLAVMVLTTRGDEESRKEALDGGASDYLTKPFEPPVLARHVRELLDRK
jgi:two-component system chemotaxis response regulator CheY